jgi:hypothetical protein
VNINGDDGTDIPASPFSRIIYSVIGDPPVSTGGDQLIDTAPGNGDVAARAVGGPGEVLGVTVNVAGVPGEAPSAATDIVYGTPLLRPEYITELSDPTLFIGGFGTTTFVAVFVTITEYPVMGEPPLFAGADHERLILELPANPLRFRGIDGMPNGIPVIDASGDIPTLFCALTVNVYDAPFTRPVKVVSRGAKNV